MSSRRVAPLDDECLVVEHDVDTDPYALQLRPVVFEWMRDEGYPLEDIKTVYNNVSLKNSGNSGYVVMEVETLEYPIDIADSAVDQTTLWVCSCADYHYRRSPDLRDGERPSDGDTCAHIDKVKRKERQSVDDPNQSELRGASD